MNTLKTIGRNAVLFAIGGTIYYMIELIWRGYSSLPMVLVGGLCFLFCGSINEFLGWDMLIWKQMFICAAGITAIEFLSGYILNIVLRLGIWDYSNMPFNIIGQICLPFTVAWYILSFLSFFSRRLNFFASSLDCSSLNFIYNLDILSCIFWKSFGNKLNSFRISYPISSSQPV